MLMPFDTNWPPDHAELDGGPFRDQFNSLNDQDTGLSNQLTDLSNQVADLPTSANVNDAIVSNTPRNCDNVTPFTGTFSNPPTQSELVAFKTWANGWLAALKRS